MRVVQVLARDHQHIASITDGLLTRLATAAGQNQECLATSEQFHDSMMHDVTKLMHIYLHLLILRAAMRPLLRFDGPIAEMGIADHEGRVRSNMDECTGDFAAYIQSLKAEETIGLWPPWCQTAFSSLCFSLLLMVSSSATHDEAARWTRRLQVVRRELRLKSGSFSVLRLGLLRIDSIFWRGVDKVLDLKPHVADALRNAREI